MWSAPMLFYVSAVADELRDDIRRLKGYRANGITTKEGHTHTHMHAHAHTYTHTYINTHTHIERERGDGVWLVQVLSCVSD